MTRPAALEVVTPPPMSSEHGSAAPRPVRATVDASDLPSVVYGTRVVTWWGTVAFMVVESATLVACLTAYYYIARNYPSLPPARTPLPDLVVPTIGLVVLLASCVPTYLFKRAAERFDVRALIRWQWVAIAITVVALVLRFLEFPALNVRWDANAYASAAWAVVFAHFTLLLVDLLETLVFAVLVSSGRAPDRFIPGVAEDATYTFFMVAAWIPCYVTVYLVPRWV